MIGACISGDAMPKRKRKPGRPRGTTRGGSRPIQFRVSDAQYAELEAEGPTANLAAKARAFPAPPGEPATTKGDR